MRPSFIGAGINGLLMVVVIVLTIIYWHTMDSYQRIILMSVISIQIGIHAILHHFEEVLYGYNPLENKIAN